MDDHMKRKLNKYKKPWRGEEMKVVGGMVSSPAVKKHMKKTRTALDIKLPKFYEKTNGVLNVSSPIVNSSSLDNYYDNAIIL